MDENYDYSYVKEHTINQYLKCFLCSKPYIDPVRTEDNLQGCRNCFLSKTRNRNLLCVNDEQLLERLNNLPVQCLKCHKDDLLRIQFDEHRTNHCPKRIVSCLAANRRCPWTGPFEDLDDHFKSCAFKANDDYEKLRQQQFESQLKQLIDLFENQFKKNQQLEQEIEILKKLSLQQMKTIAQLQNEIKQYEQMKNQLQNYTDIESIKQLVDQHDIQIKLFVRKQTVVPVVTPYSDPNIEKLIDHSFANTELNLDNQHLDNQAMNIVSKKGILEKKCRKLRLENNKLTGKGATIIANSLYNNQFLTELYLSKNHISDIGVHAFAQILSIQNSTLMSLELDSNEITDEGIEYLADMLKINRTLVRLGLGSNQISDNGLQFIANTLIYSNQRLQWLSLTSNRLITDESYSIIREMLVKRSGLKTLWIDKCSLSSNTVELLKQVIETNENFEFKI